MISRVSLGFLLSLALIVGAAPPWVSAASHQSTANAPGVTVNINTASRTELMKLKGVGRELAGKIVEFREKNGPFAKPEDIRKVSGVGKGIWEANHEAIVVK